MRVEVKIYEINLGWNVIEIALVNLAESIDALVIAELSKSSRELLVGLPEAEANPCSLALAYLYTIEDIEMGSRIRNKAILFLANLLGLSQARDVVEIVKECKTLALIGAPGEPGKAIPETLNKLGVIDYNVKRETVACTREALEKITLSRVTRL